MASGRIYGSVTQRPDSYVYYIDWSENGVDVANNKSNVYAEVHILCNKHTSYQSNRYQELWIAGTMFSNSLYISLSPRNRCNSCKWNCI